MAHAFTVLFLEVEAGLRPRKQLRNLICPKVFGRLSDVWIRPSTDPAHVRSMHGSRCAPGRYEAVALVDRPARVTALAFSLVRGAGGWQVDDLIRPEDGPLPESPYPLPQDEPDIFELVLG